MGITNRWLNVEISHGKIDRWDLWLVASIVESCPGHTNNADTIATERNNWNYSWKRALFEKHRA